MSAKLLIRKQDTPPATSEYVTYQQAHPNSLYPDLELPPQGVQEMMERLMLRVQARVRPGVTWEKYDSWALCTIAMRWWDKDTPVDLRAQANYDGFGVWLLSGSSELAYWRVGRFSNDIEPDDSGYLEVHRSECAYGGRFYTGLTFEDPVVDDIPRRRPPYLHRWDPVPELDELGADIVQVTREYLRIAGVISS